MSAEQTPDIAAVASDVLRLHWIDSEDDERGILCWCDEWLTTEEDYRAHVAQALAPVLAAAVRDAEQRVTAEVWCSPGRQSGQPCLAGTRMPTRTVAELVDSRGDVAFVQRCYPHLTEQQIWSAIEFESLNGRGKAFRKRLRRLMRERRSDLRADRVAVDAPEGGEGR